MAWLTAKEVTGRLGAPLLNCVQFCYIGQCCGGMCVNTRTCLNSCFFSFSLGPVPHPCAPCAWVPPPSALASQVGRLFGWVGPFLPWRSGTLHISVLGAACCSVHDEAPSLPTLCINHYCAPQSTIIYSPSACTSTTVSTVNGSWKLTSVDLVCVSHAV